MAPVGSIWFERAERSPRGVGGGGGSGEMARASRPRMACGRRDTSVAVNGRSAVARYGEDCLTLTSGAPLEAVDGGARARFSLKEGEGAGVLLRWNAEA